MTSASFTRLLTKTISTRRNPAPDSAGKRGAPAANLSGVASTRLYPVSAEKRLQMGIESPYVLWELYVGSGVDIVNGDIVVMDSVEYPVKFTELWPWRLATETYRRVVVEEQRW